MSPGIFTISLDFELHWGGVEKRTLPEYEPYFRNTRKVIPRMLDLFATYEVHATWATVGMLFHESLSELQANLPTQHPAYKDQSISIYHYLQTRCMGQQEQDDPFHFAPSLIRAIAATPHQEIGTHTYSHYYCNEPGQTPETFREDLRAAKRAAAPYEIQLNSLVFPRNQFIRDYLKVCYEEGIHTVRSNPNAWFWNITTPSNETLLKRIYRGADAFLAVSKTSYSLESLRHEPGVPLCIPASRFLRPYDPRLGPLNNLRLQRIKREMTVAAQLGEVYHLWWHPHNFGAYPEESMKGLVLLMEHYDSLKRKYGMGSRNMGEISRESLVGSM